MRLTGLAPRSTRSSASFERIEMDDTEKKAQFVICVRNDDYPASLDLRKIYRVVEDEDSQVKGFLRVIDESGEDYLYPPECFIYVDLPRSVRETIAALG